MSPLPPNPLHLLRSHSAAVTALAWSDDNERIYSADSSGKVVVTSSRSLRPISVWNAHTDSVMAVEEWEDYIVTHGRDNKLHVWKRLEELPFSQRIGGSAGLQDIQAPELYYSMDVNAMNFCRFSMLKQTTLIALPNLVDSTTVDIWSLPSQDRIHAAIGQEADGSVNQTGRNPSGIIMGIHLYQHGAEPRNLRLLSAYENGSVVLREYRPSEKSYSVEGQGWEIIWKAKIHVETIMAMRVSRANTFALTVSADHIVGRYDLTTDTPPDDHGVVYRTNHPGNGSLAIRDDGKVCAVGGWDGRIRLYSTKSFKSLGTLKYHKSAAQCLEFARSISDEANFAPDPGEDDDDGDMSTEDIRERTRWLVGGSKDCRVSVWSLISFSK